MRKWFITELPSPINGCKYVIEDGNKDVYWFGYYTTLQDAKKGLRLANRSHRRFLAYIKREKRNK